MAVAAYMDPKNVEGRRQAAVAALAELLGDDAPEDADEDHQFEKASVSVATRPTKSPGRPRDAPPRAVLNTS